MWRKLFNDEKGSTFMLVIIGFCVLFIFTIGMIFIGNVNSRSTIREENRAKAYYIAKTGAESYINHLEKEIKLGNDIFKDLDDLNGKTSKLSTFEDGTFDIKIDKIIEKNSEKEAIEKYKIITTGRVNEEKSILIAMITPSFSGGGYNTGDGKIFINSDTQLVIGKVPQLSGSGLDIYTNGKRTMDVSSRIFINQNNVSNLFIQISDRKSKGGDTVGSLSSQREEQYSLEIQETKNGNIDDGTLDRNSTISKNNLIKREKLVRYNSNEKNALKDSTFEEIGFRYDTTQEDVLDYFSKGKLSIEDITDTQIKEGLKSTFLIPIETIKEYKDYIKGNSIYPSKTNYEFPSDGRNEGSLILEEEEKIKVDLKDSSDIKFGNITLNNGAELYIDTKGDTNIYIDGKIDINDSSMTEKIHINANGKVNFHIKQSAAIEGELKAFLEDENSEVNIYMYNGEFQSNNKANIEDVNLYVPNHKVQFDKVSYKGIIVAKEIQFGDDATFEAPSSGPASNGFQKSSTINIDWVSE